MGATIHRVYSRANGAGPSHPRRFWANCANRLFDGLLGAGLPLVGLSVGCGTLALVLLARGWATASRALAVGAVASIVVGWGVAQYPEMLQPGLTVATAAAPDGTLVGLVVVSVAALALVGPSLALLFALDQRSRLESHGGPWL
jgi:cytochrome d ubiquinol oxidase subunit II